MFAKFLMHECGGCIAAMSGQCREESEDRGQKVRAKVIDCGRPKGNGAKAVRILRWLCVLLRLSKRGRSQKQKKREEGNEEDRADEINRKRRGVGEGFKPPSSRS